MKKEKQVRKGGFKMSMVYTDRPYLANKPHDQTNSEVNFDLFVISKLKWHLLVKNSRKIACTLQNHDKPSPTTQFGNSGTQVPTYP